MAGDALSASCTSGTGGATCKVTWSMSCSWGATGTWSIELRETTGLISNVLVQSWSVDAKTGSFSKDVSPTVYITSSKFYFALNYDCSASVDSLLTTSNLTIHGMMPSLPAVTFPTKNYFVTVGESFYVRWTKLNSTLCPSLSNAKLTDTCSGGMIAMDANTFFNGSRLTSLSSASDCGTSTFVLTFQCGNGYPSLITATSSTFNIYGQGGLAVVSPVAYQALRPTDSILVELKRTYTIAGSTARKLQLVRGTWFFDPIAAVTGSNVVYEWPNALDTTQQAPTYRVNLSVITDWKLSEGITNPQYYFVVVNAIKGTLFDSDASSLPFFVKHGSYGVAVDVGQTLVDIESDDAASFCEGPFDSESAVTGVFARAVCSSLASIDLESLQLAFSLNLVGTAQSELALTEFYWETSGSYTFAVEADGVGDLSLVATMAVSITDIEIDISLPDPIGFAKSISFTVLSAEYVITIDVNATMFATLGLDATGTVTVPLPIQRSFSVALQNVKDGGSDQVQSPVSQYIPLIEPSFSGAIDFTVNLTFRVDLVASFSNYIEVVSDAKFSLEVLTQLQYPPFPASIDFAPAAPVCTGASHFVQLSVFIGFDCSARASLAIPFSDPMDLTFGELHWRLPIYKNCYRPGTMASLLENSAASTGYLTLPPGGAVRNGTSRLVVALARSLQAEFPNVSLVTLQVILTSAMDVTMLDEHTGGVGSDSSSVQVTVFDTSGSLTSSALTNATTSPDFSLGPEYGFAPQPLTTSPGTSPTNSPGTSPTNSPGTSNTTSPGTSSPTNASGTSNTTSPGTSSPSNSSDTSPTPVPSDENEDDDSQKTLVYVVVACCSVVFVAACGLLIWKLKPCESTSALPSPDLSQSFIPLSEKLGAQFVEVAHNSGDIELPTMESVVTIVTEDEEDPIL
jgi:hypothetical protein